MNESVAITASDLELEPVFTVSAGTSIVEAARLLAANRCGTLLVDRVPLAEITDHDLVRALARDARRDLPVGELVTDAPMFVDHDARVETVVAAMLHEHRRSVVVVDRGRGAVVGLLTLAVAMSAVLGGPSWLGALRVALQIESTSQR